MATRKKILLVEDSRTQAEMLVFILDQSGYDTAIATDGLKAIDALHDIDPDLIISDVIMPHMNGYEFCSEIKSDNKLCHIPVLLLTTLDESEDMLVGLECGADSYLMKPYNEKILLDRIEQMLSVRRPAKNKPKKYNFTYQGNPYEIKTERRKMIDLLVTVYESAVDNNKKLADAQDELSTLNSSLEEKIIAGTQELQNKIHEQQKIENELKTSEDRYRRFIENANIGIFLIDLDGRITFGNKTLAEILDVRSSRFLAGDMLSDFFDSKRKYELIRDEAINNGKVLDKELKMVTPKRMPRWVTMNLVYTGDRISGMVFDRTGKKFIQERDNHYRDVLKNAKEAAVRSDQQKSQFLSGMANQVKAPINLITAYTYLLAYNGIPGNQRENYCRQVELGSFDLRKKITDVLDLSRIESGIATIEKNDLNISELLLRMTGNFNRRIELMGKEGLEVVFSPSEDTKKLELVADRLKIERIVEILLDNAIHYTQKGEINLRSGMKGADFVISIEDNGPGIQEDLRGRIFNRFKPEVYKEKADHGDGSGLGLTVAKMIAELMKGDLRLDEDYDQGAKFIFTFPFQQKHIDKQLLHAETFAENLSTLAGKTVLVVEDEYDTYLLLTAFLEHTGVRILRSDNGTEAIRVFGSGVDIDILIMDLKLHWKIGQQAVSAIRKVDSKIPILVITADQSEAEKDTFLKECVNEIISKPVEQDYLLECLVKHAKNNMNG